MRVLAIKQLSIPSLIMGLLAVPICAWAEWTGKGEAGVALASSNADTTTSTINGKFDLANELTDWKHSFGASIIYASSKNEFDVKETTANRWEGHQQSDYKFSDRGFWFENLRYESDRIGGFVYQAAATTGLGYKFLDTDTSKLAAQLGAGYKQFKQRALAPFVATGNHDAIVSGMLDIQQRLTDNTTLTEKLTIESGVINTSAQNDLALQVKMSDVLGLALGYQLRYNSKPAMRTATESYEKYDRLATANLVYEFK